MKTRAVRYGTCLLAVLAMWAGGCQDAREDQIRGQQEKILVLEEENANLRDQLAYAYNERDSARDRMTDLQRLLDEARRRLSDAQNQSPVVINDSGNLPAGWEGTKDIAWTELSTDILFDSGRADLKKNGRQVLQEVANQIRSQFGNRMILVVGHTDTDPIRKTKNLWNSNLDLSQGRAATVAKVLYELGIDRTRVIAGGQGEWKPAVRGSDKNSKAKNRRVEILAITSDARM